MAKRKSDELSALDDFDRGGAGGVRESQAELDKQSEPDTSEHKEYTVLIDGAVINGELLNIGDIVTLHPDDARRHTDADVRLSEVKQAA